MNASEGLDVTPLEVIHEFIAGVDNGTLRSDLAEDCLLNFCSRSVPGGPAATGFLRSQLTHRYRHDRFDVAAPSLPDFELSLFERFGRSFDRMRRRLYDQRERVRAPTTTTSTTSTTLHLRPESGDDDDELPGERTLPVTPPRPSSHGLSTLKFLEAIGLLNSCSPNYSRDGGVDLGEFCTVHLVLGYRHVQMPARHVRDIEICLVVYECYPVDILSPTARPPLRQRANGRCNPTTDDEAEGAPPPPAPTRRRMRGVRRTLFGEERREEDVGGRQLTQEQSARTAEDAPQEVEEEEIVFTLSEIGSSHILTPRKRHQTTSGNEMTPKKTTGQKRLRF
ncbi:cell cycle negative regulator roughex [Drosophila gunungcola]|uniref:Cell cycle negative regulator roughex n=1 Tax=Drosophila gunungcola TaxID=103775 RepID=A0A9P9YBS1_9MUSC|nr:cell cycle negative regulator roughex [Drosophila gunungcola]KAI8034046.1 hypothetical protein M5D96_013206 [Drosophila gunungcola]